MDSTNSRWINLDKPIYPTKEILWFQFSLSGICYKLPASIPCPFSEYSTSHGPRCGIYAEASSCWLTTQRIFYLKGLEVYFSKHFASKRYTTCYALAKTTKVTKSRFNVASNIITGNLMPFAIDSWVDNSERRSQQTFSLELTNSM